MSVLIGAKRSQHSFVHVLQFWLNSTSQVVKYFLDFYLQVVSNYSYVPVFSREDVMLIPVWCA